MRSLIKKSMLLGLGITALTKDKVERVITDLKRDGEINTKEGKELIRYLAKEAENKEKELKIMVKKHVESAIKESKIATMAEIARLEKIIKAKTLPKEAKKKAKAKGKKRR